MRIAVSGTHGVGKSTLIDEFLSKHQEFIHEPEPYIILVEDFGEEFSDEPNMEDFRRQLDFNIDRLRQHTPGEKVIYERCPIDFLAYIDALEPGSVEALLGPVAQAMRHLDLVVYLPLDKDQTLESEYPKLQKAVDRRLNAMLLDDELGIVSTPVVEATGSTAQRLSVVVNEYQTRNPVTSRRE
ncbi:MAG TPA: AAA family ATPase [Pyrinomonadaceae bacterium]|nr:AAA family ATPase [Pyrinomonadaceae bacterium]